MKKLPIKIRIPIRPVPASRPRVPRYGKPYFPKTYKLWRENASIAIPDSSMRVAAPVSVTVLFAIPRAKTSKLIVPVGDGDNYEKALYDLLQKKGYLDDDKWITSGQWAKRFLPTGEVGYTEITIKAETDVIDIT